jgi:hypothetical protein
MNTKNCLTAITALALSSCASPFSQRQRVFVAGSGEIASKIGLQQEALRALGVRQSGEQADGSHVLCIQGEREKVQIQGVLESAVLEKAMMQIVETCRRGAEGTLQVPAHQKISAIREPGTDNFHLRMEVEGGKTCETKLNPVEMQQVLATNPNQEAVLCVKMPAPTSTQVAPASSGVVSK